MSQRITVKDVREAFARYQGVCNYYGLHRDGYQLTLQEGSSTYGIGWRVYEVKEDEIGGGQYEPMIGFNYLGATAREAWDELNTRARAIDEAIRLRERRMSGEAIR